MLISRVQPQDAERVQAFYGIYREVGLADTPETFVASPIEEIVSILTTPTARFAFAAFLGSERGRPVVSGWAAKFLQENADHMFVLPRVVPSERRRGHGSEMLERLEAHAREEGCRVLNVQSSWASEFGVDGLTSPTVTFAQRHGYAVGLVEMVRRLDLPLAPARVASIAEDVRSHAQGYAVHAWIGPVPEVFVLGWAILDAAISTDAPTGDLDRDAQLPSAEAIRDEERVQRESGLTSVGAVAVDRSGDVVAYTEMIIARADSGPARQGGTLVAAGHRGNRLGLAVKRAAIELLQRQRPDVTATMTQNAITNEQMVAINDRFGYRPIGYVGILQKRLVAGLPGP